MGFSLCKSKSNIPPVVPSLNHHLESYCSRLIQGIIGFYQFSSEFLSEFDSFFSTYINMHVIYEFTNFLSIC